MATTDLSVINAAAGRTGDASISTLNEDTPVAIIASSNYENLVKSELSLAPWKRATKVASLNRIDPDTAGDPPAPWSAAYQLPNDLLEIRTVMVSGQPIDYSVFSSKILCDAAESDDVVLHYIWRVPESEWPPWFREGVIRRMEAIFLRGIGERYREAQARDDAADEQFARARNRDAQSQTSRTVVTSPTLAARSGLTIGPRDTWPR